MATIHLPPDFREFLKLLNANGVKYLLIGGYAVAYHGYPRATGDIDIWVAMEKANAQKIVLVLKELGFDLPNLTPVLFLKEEQIIRMGNPPYRIEIATTISGVDFEDCHQSRIIGTIEEIEIPIINLEKLRVNKKAAGRFKDLNDLENLP
ncbi:MAG: hypothetical protein RL595_2199 [Planctomycetota bacterium]|jgi:hypothetical protein